MREKMSKQPPPTPTASAIGPCPTIFLISGTPLHWKFTQHLRTTPYFSKKTYIVTPSLEPSHWDGSNERSTMYVLCTLWPLIRTISVSKNKENYPLIIPVTPSYLELWLQMRQKWFKTILNRHEATPQNEMYSLSVTEQRCLQETAQHYKMFRMTVLWEATYINPIALRKAKIVCNFDLSECNRVKVNR